MISQSRRRPLLTVVVALAAIGLPFSTAHEAEAQIPSGVGVIGPFAPVEEGQRAVFTIAVTNAPSPDPITLKFSTVDSPTFLVSSLVAEPGKDYTRVLGRSVTLSPANSYRATVEVAVLDDSELEGVEPFAGQIHNLSANAVAVVPTAAGFINASDVATVTIPPITVPRIPPISVPTIPSLGPLIQFPKLAVDDVTAGEGTGTNTDFVFVVRRTGSALVPVSVGYRTVDGTAVAGQDYTERTGGLQLDIGETAETVRVPVHGDDAREAGETFSLELTYVYGASVADRAGVATILDDDAPPPPPPSQIGSPRAWATADDGGYWLHDRKGQVVGFGNAQQVGGVANILASGSARIVALSSDQGQTGVWLVDHRGGVYALGSARFFGSMPGLLNAGLIRSLPEAVDIEATPGGDGYAILSKDGGVFTFGTAPFFGSLHTLVAQGQIARLPEAVALAYTPSGNGYWIVSADGGVFTFGDAAFFGSVPGLRAQRIAIGSQRIVAMAPARGATGYTLVDEYGGIFTFGGAPFHGSVPALVAGKVIPRAVRVLGAEYTATNDGYWIFGRAGGVYTFGNAKFVGAAQFPEDDPPPPKPSRRRRK